ncbi:hypothetical protein [Bacillus coahuilensis]
MLTPSSKQKLLNQYQKSYSNAPKRNRAASI